MRRREFLTKTGLGVAGLTTLDFVRHFHHNGLPETGKAFAMAEDKAAEAEEPRFLIYWYVEGGWMGYSMFNPLVTANNLVKRLPNPTDERYRVKNFGDPQHKISQDGDITYGYLAEAGKPLFEDMAILSSMHTGTFHSGERLKAHMGSYRLRLPSDREDDERDVIQAFCEAVGRPYLLPNIGWFRWLADGELNEAQYTGRKGFYYGLGPAWAHTIYAGPPAKLRRLLSGMYDVSHNVVNREVSRFLDDVNRQLTRDDSLEVVKSYNAARQIYQRLNAGGAGLDPIMLSKLFRDPDLRARFKVQPGDELITYRGVNGNKARSKFIPNSNVQAMMAYELIRAGLSCGFWIESRAIRGYDSHRSRARLWNKKGEPIGQTDQTTGLKRDLWDPLVTLVDLLKNTQYKNTGKSLYDLTTIVLTSEFGRTINGDVDGILKNPKLSDEEKKKMVTGQDICQHWKVTSAAFLGGNVRGHTQFGRVGTKSMTAIPLLPDGSLDPHYDAVTGELLPGKEDTPGARIPNHGDVYATALSLAGLNPKGRGRNDRPPLDFICKA